MNRRSIRMWLTPGLGVKRWLILLTVGIAAIATAIAQAIIEVYRDQPFPEALNLVTLHFLPPSARVLVGAGLGAAAIGIALLKLNRSILAPFVRRGPLIAAMYSHSRRQKGI